MSSQDVDYSRNILNRGGVELPDSAPPNNHGHTPAAWFLTIVCIVGAVLMGVSLPIDSTPLLIVGIVVAVVGLFGGIIMSALGKGQTHAARR